jgi:hypothetical protein
MKKKSTRREKKGANENIRREIIQGRYEKIPWNLKVKKCKISCG